MRQRTLGPEFRLNPRRDMDGFWQAETGQSARPRGPYEFDGIDDTGTVAPPFALLAAACDTQFNFTPAFVYRTGAGMDERRAAWNCAADVFALGQRRSDLRPVLGGLMRQAMNAVSNATPDAGTPQEMMAQVRQIAADNQSDTDAAVTARVQTCARAHPGPWQSTLDGL